MQRRTLFAGMIGAGFLAGCANPYVRSVEENEERKAAMSPKLGTFTAEDAEANDIELPANYSAENYKQMKLAVSFRMLDVKSVDKFAIERSQTLSAMFESEMTKLGRFKILSRSDLGQLALADEKRFQDTSNIDSTTRMRLKQFGADYVLTAGITLKTENYNRVKHAELMVEVLVTYQLINVSTGEIEDADSAKGLALRQYFMTPSGRYIGGFNINDPRQGDSVVNEAAVRALISLANKLGNKFPVGGRVIGGFGDMLQVDGGRNAGIVDSQVGVLYSNVYGVDVGLAYVNLVPGKTSTQGKIIKWTNNSDAKRLVQQYKKDPAAFAREFETYVVTKSMPMPKDWQKYM